VPAHQCVAHRVKKGLDSELGVTVRELPKTGRQLFDQV
jgi:hypothetical protein